jgi:hypothetical protein
MQEHDRFTTFHISTVHGLGPASPPVVVLSASGELLTDSSDHVPFWSSLSAPLACYRSRRLSAVHVRLAIPCLALAPNRLMLAVATSPHGSVTTLSDVATSSQALLIQPGRALEAELQVRSSFPESLQLLMQLRVAQKSSIPRATTESAAGVGRSMMRRKTVIHELVIPKRAASRAPRLPLVDRPIA